LQRHLEARRAKGKGTPSDAEGGVGVGCCGTVSSKWAKGTGGPAGDECYNLIAQPTAYRWQNDRDGLQQDNVVAALRASQGASGFHEMNHPVITQPVPFTKAKRAQSTSDDETWVDGQVNPTLSLFDQGDTRATTVAVAHAFYSTGGTHGVNQHPEVSPAVKVGSGLGIPSPPAVAQSTTVRRLMPIEVERLQGFPDNWTMIPYRGKPADQCPDGPRYKALGNSMACNCMAWIGERIAAYEAQNGST
jgi:site-specific DNA-cytosine methylase